jgi:hypothetical protein
MRRKSQECFVLNKKWGGSHAVGSNRMIITAWRGSNGKFAELQGRKSIS